MNSWTRIFAWPCSSAVLLSVLVVSPVLAVDPLQAGKLVEQRKQLFEAWSYAMNVQADLILFQVENGRWPNDASEMDLPATATASPEQGVSELRIDHGTIVVTLGGQIDASMEGEVLAISPCVKGDAIPTFACGQSVCAQTTLAVEGAPTGYSLTTLDNEKLPAACRGPGADIMRVWSAARKGDPDAEAQMAAILVVGQAAVVDRREALHFVRHAAEKGQPAAQGLLGALYEEGVEGELEPDLVSAYVWFTRSEKSGLEAATAYRKRLASRLSPAQLEKAKEMLSD